MANTLSAFVSAFPVTGSFSRTAVNAQSNVATPAGGVVCGTLVCYPIRLLYKFHKL